MHKQPKNPSVLPLRLMSSAGPLCGPAIRLRTEISSTPSSGQGSEDEGYGHAL